MYLASMVLKHHEDQGQPAEELHGRVGVPRTALPGPGAAAQRAAQFPQSLALGRLLMRVLIFPRGLTYFAPADRLGRKVADLVMTRVRRAIA